MKKVKIIVERLGVGDKVFVKNQIISDEDIKKKDQNIDLLVKRGFAVYIEEPKQVPKQVVKPISKPVKEASSNESSKKEDQKEDQKEDKK